MNNWKNYIAMCFLCLGMVGCATAPLKYEVENNRSVNLTYDEAWETTIRFFADNNLPIKNIEKDSGIVYSDAMNVPYSYMDCGSNALMHPVFNKGSFNVFVTRFTNENVRVNINTRFTETRQFASNPPIVVECNSTGVLEDAFFKNFAH